MFTPTPFLILIIAGFALFIVVLFSVALWVRSADAPAAAATSPARQPEPAKKAA